MLVPSKAGRCNGGGGGRGITAPYSLLRLVEALLLSRLLSSAAHVKEEGLVGGARVPTFLTEDGSYCRYE